MNRTQRRQAERVARRTPPRAVDPYTWATVISDRQQMGESAGDDVMTKLHSAFADLRSGSTDDELFDRMAATVNVGIVRAEQIDELCVAPMLAMRDALLRCDDIRGKHGRYGFDGPGLQAMAAGLDVYEEMVRNSTTAQMRAAMTLSIARMHEQVRTQVTTPTTTA